MKPYKTLNSKLIFESNYLSLYEDDFESGNGKKGKYYYTKSRGAGVLVVALDKSKENFIMVSEYKYPIKKFIVNFAAGIKEAEDTEEYTAHKELFEETGYKAGQMEKLGEMQISSSRTADKLYIYLATDCEKDTDPIGGELTEETEVVLVPVKEAWNFALQRQVDNSYSNLAMIWVLDMLGIKR